MDHPADNHFDEKPDVEDHFESSAQNRMAYPQRPGQPDCAFFMRTGLCCFGYKCKFHHPPDRFVDSANLQDQFPQRLGQPPCKFYVKTGKCKFGFTCKFHHPVEQLLTKKKRPPNICNSRSINFTSTSSSGGAALITHDQQQSGKQFGPITDSNTSFIFSSRSSQTAVVLATSSSVNQSRVDMAAAARGAAAPQNINAMNSKYSCRSGSGGGARNTEKEVEQVKPHDIARRTEQDGYTYGCISSTDVSNSIHEHEEDSSTSTSTGVAAAGEEDSAAARVRAGHVYNSSTLPAAAHINYNSYPQQRCDAQQISSRWSWCWWRAPYASIWPWLNITAAAASAEAHHHHMHMHHPRASTDTFNSSIHMLPLPLPLPKIVHHRDDLMTLYIYPQRPGVAHCRYYMRTGQCSFGSACRFHHPWPWQPQAPNYYQSGLTTCTTAHALPSRPGAPPCEFYAKHGYCKYGQVCKFDHHTNSVPHVFPDIDNINH